MYIAEMTEMIGRWWHIYSNLERNSIAVVDDEKDIVVLFTDALSYVGFKVLGFYDLIKALEDIRRDHGKYLLVIWDIRMPGLTGVDLARLISQIDENIKIILMSAFENLEVGNISKYDFIAKPVSIHDFREYVAAKLNSWL